jgi:CubicO group peptidase (beta-lactamase class C family)
MDINKLKTELDEARSKFITPSYSVTLYKDDKAIKINDGFMDVEGKKEANSDTLYAIGSCTKSILVGALSTLIDKGLVSLDGRIKEYIPEFDMYDSYAAENLTVRDMLCHRSGLHRHDFSWFARLTTLTEEDIVNTISHLKPKHELRYKWQYNNHMYVLAGYLIRRITGDSWQDVIEKNIFEPLGIKRYAFTSAQAKKMGNCAKPYTPDINEMKALPIDYADLYGAAAAGGIYMSSSELAKWNLLLLNMGKFEDKQIISEAMCREMMTPQMIIPEETEGPLKEKITNTSYGLGLGTALFKGHRIVMHSGFINGFISAQFILPMTI